MNEDRRKVLNNFRDAEDKNFPYGRNGLYPRKGLKVSDERLEFLAKKGFIEDIEKDELKVLDENNTVKEIEKELDNRGIEYNKTMNKPEKLKLLNDSDDE